MKFSKSNAFLSVCLSFILGVFFEPYLSYFSLSVLFILFVIVVSVFSSRNIILVSFCLLLFLFGNFWLKQSQEISLHQDSFGQQVQIQGIISEEPDERLDKIFLTLNEIVIDGELLDVKLLLSVPKHPQFSYGTKLSLIGKIQEPNDAENPGEFSYKNYLSRYGIVGLVYNPKIKEASEGHGSVFKEKILELKQKFILSLSLNVPEPQNAFLAGILVGARRNIPESLIEQFNQTGTTHLIAISGFNITIIAQALSSIFERFGRRVSFILSVISIAVFVILTGASASVVRAGIMGILGLAALNTGRVYAINNALALTAVVMLLINPKILRFDIGFQLSFAALIGLVYLQPILESKFFQLPKFFKTYLLPTLAAQIFTLPLILFNFDRLSVVAPLTNLIVLPLIPITMLVGFIAGITGLIWPPLAMVMAWLAWAFAAFIIWVIEMTAKIPLASIVISKFSPIMMFVSYGVLLLFLSAYYYPSQLSKIKLWSKTNQN